MKWCPVSDRLVIHYVEAIGRNPGEEHGRSHLYAENMDGDYTPMCRYGWNRSDGAALSIFRGHRGQRGTCRVCLRRVYRGLPPVEAVPGSHKTKWI